MFGDACRICPGRRMRRVRQVNRKTFLLHARKMSLSMTPSQSTRRLSVELTLMTDTTGTTGISKKVLAREKQTATDKRILKPALRLSAVSVLTTGTTGTTRESKNFFLTCARRAYPFKTTCPLLTKSAPTGRFLPVHYGMTPFISTNNGIVLEFER